MEVVRRTDVDSLVPTRPRSNILSLPAELHLIIAGYLNDIMHRILRLTNRYFYELLPRVSLDMPNSGTRTILVYEELWRRAVQASKSSVERMYGCALCLMLRRRSSFDDSMIRSENGLFDNPSCRYCVDCCLKPQEVTWKGRDIWRPYRPEPPYYDLQTVTILQELYKIQKDKETGKLSLVPAGPADNWMCYKNVYKN